MTLSRCSFIHRSLPPGDELFSDTYKVKLVDDCLYEVYGKVRAQFLSQ